MSSCVPEVESSVRMESRSLPLTEATDPRCAAMTTMSGSPCPRAPSGGDHEWSTTLTVRNAQQTCDPLTMERRCLCDGSPPAPRNNGRHVQQWLPNARSSRRSAPALASESDTRCSLRSLIHARQSKSPSDTKSARSTVRAGLAATSKRVTWKLRLSIGVATPGGVCHYFR